MLCLALLAYAPSAQPQANAAPVLVAGLGGLAAAGIVAWALARGVPHVWLRASLAMMAVMGTAVVGAFTVPAHGLAGRAGLAALFLVCLAVIGAAWRLLLRKRE